MSVCHSAGFVLVEAMETISRFWVKVKALNERTERTSLPPITTRCNRETAIPVGYMVDEVLLKHEAPSFHNTQKRGFEGASIHFHPAVKYSDWLQMAHFLIDLLVGIYLLFKLLKRGRGLWDAILGMGLYFLRSEDVTIQKELAEELLPVINIEVGIVVKGTAVVATN